MAVRIKVGSTEYHYNLLLGFLCSALPCAVSLKVIMAEAGEGSPHTTVLHAAWALWLHLRSLCSLGVLAGLTPTQPRPSSSPLLLYLHRDLNCLRTITIRDREPRTASLTFTQLLSSDQTEAGFCT